MPRVRLNIKPTHHDLASFTTDYPDDEFKILSTRPTDEGVLVLLEAETPDATTIIDHLEATPEVTSHEVLHADEQVVVVRYVVPNPEPHNAALSSGNLPKYPLVVQNGWIFSELITSQERLSEFKRGLDAAGVTFEILSVTPSTDPAKLLTDRQRQFMAEAIRSGYYDTPRQCSLTDLAAVLEVNKSTASRVLHRAESRLIKDSLAGMTV